MKSLSIRAPWWWFILHGGKDIENRKWSTDFRGTVLIHAAKTVPHRDTEEDIEFGIRVMAQTGISCLGAPPLADFLRPETRGAIVGKVDIVGCTTYSASPWFFGRFGFMLANPVTFAQPIPFVGMLGFFDVPDDLVRNAVPIAA